MTQGHPATLRRQKAMEFYRQGLQHLEEEKVLAAAASLKLALSYDPKNEEIAAAHDRAVEASAGATAANAYKRAVFEESVGRVEAAARYYADAANTFPRYTYCFKAAELLNKTGDYLTAKKFAETAAHSKEATADAKLLLAEIFHRAGLTKNAKATVDRLLKEEPKNNEAKELLRKIKRG